jgi:Ser/Thr protein kinase RdoA (MazF antagonist)
MSNLGHEPDVYGLIHADLHRGNILFEHGRVNVIDFEVSGWGHFAYDIGVTFSVLRDYSIFPALREAFFRGYRRVRPLSVEHETMTNTFMAGRIMGHSLWMAAFADDPMFGPAAQKRANVQLDYLKRTVVGI